ncbi:hypothetical protein INT44_002625 [Umbelopsis vinacea]|uniref:Xylanolytic transcriptional activator regulatory domain-containing protein n=1 Tax=Umbelopsis vinacea TaxID=44442 RepID=A0A8H7U828_9FUNG|nr:hypothetical protein INT44_002625 [Umbelopsis vinacea]
MESSYSKLVTDLTETSRYPETDIPLSENLLNNISYSDKATFPDLESYIDLSVQSIMPSSTRTAQMTGWGQIHLEKGNGVSDGSTSEEDSSSLQSDETPPLSDSSLIPLLALYFDRMHPVIPIFKRSWLFSRLDKSHHMTDIQFGALLIAMSAAALLQPVQIGDRCCVKNSNTKRALYLLEESHRMHSSSKLGNNPSIDAIMTSFYMFVILSSTGNDDAAWLRLSESVSLGHIMKLHESSAYENIDEDERERRLRVYWLLTITERAYALQRGHSIGFRGRPGASMTAIKRRFNIGQMDDFPHSQLKLFDIVDEDFVDCWNGRCSGTKCHNRDMNKAIALYTAFTNDTASKALETKVLAIKNPSTPNNERNAGHDNQYRSTSQWQPLEIQLTDVLVTRQWLLNRLWYICLSHGLIDPKAAHIALRPDFPIRIARDMLDTCSKLSIYSLEAHGLGLCEKLYDIARTLVTVFHLFPECVTNMDTEGAPNTRSHDSNRNQNENIAREQQQESPNTQMQLPHLLTGQSDMTSIHNIIANVEAGQEQYSKASSSPKQPITDKHILSVSSTSTSPQLNPSQLQRSASNITDIVNAYISLFMKLRSGSHPYLQKLLDSVQCLNDAKDSVVCS